MSELKPTLGLGALLFYGVGMILGAGIYSVIGPAAAQAGDAIWASFLLASFVAFLTGLSYAELATRIPKAGAEFSYLQKAAPQLPSLRFITGIMVCVLGAATAATVALSFAGYLQGFVRLPEIPVALGIILLMTAVNIIGLQVSSKMNMLFTTIELSGLVIIIYLGMQKGGFAEGISLPKDSGFLPATGLLFFSYLGFENISALAEESKDPRRHIPMAMIGSVIITTIVYLLVGFATLALVDTAALEGQEAPLAFVAGAGSQKVVPYLQAVALFATANTALIGILSASRVLFEMGRKKAVPQALTRVLSKRGSPWLSTLAVCAAALLLLPLGKVDSVAQIASLVSLLVFGVVHITLIILRVKEPGGRNFFRVPGAVAGIPVLPCVGLVTIAFMLLQFSAEIYLYVALILFAAAAIYLLSQRVRERKTATSTS